MLHLPASPSASPTSTTPFFPRNPTAQELRVLQRELDKALTYYRAHLDDARKLLQFGQIFRSPGTALGELRHTR
jgi:hypothetical protein